MPAFRYFERIDEAAGSYTFWEISVEGPTLHLRHGPVGTAGTHEIETCASEATAQHEYELRIAAQREAGFRETLDRRLDERTRALEAAIDADPDDLSAYLVYADWIQTLGDPRGALIVAQIETPGPRADAYLTQHAAMFLGPLAERVGYTGAPFELTWKAGFIESATICVQLFVDRPTRERALDMLLDHGSARWLRELTLRCDRDYPIPQSTIDALARRRIPSLRTLTLSIGSREEVDEVGMYWDTPRTDLSELWPALADLRRLAIDGDPLHVGTPDLPACGHLAIKTTTIDLWAEHLAAAHLPAIEHFELELTAPFPATATVAQLRPALDSFGRRVEHLALRRIGYGDALCATIAQLRRPSLRELDLQHNDLTDDEANLLVASGLRLDMLDVSHNRLTYRGIAALGTIAQLVIADRQVPRY